jgi:hypothetical protein
MRVRRRIFSKYAGRIHDRPDIDGRTRPFSTDGTRRAGAAATDGLHRAGPCSRTIDGSCMGRHRLYRRRLLFVDLENGLTAGSRSEGREKMRGIRTRRLRGGELFRARLRGTGDLHRILQATALESVLYRGRPNLSGGTKRRDSALQLGRTRARPVPVPRGGVCRRAITRFHSPRAATLLNASRMARDRPGCSIRPAAAKQHAASGTRSSIRRGRYCRSHGKWSWRLPRRR